MMIILRTFLIVISLILTGYGCHHTDFSNSEPVQQKPTISPDYAETTIPPNIAPLNFIIQEEGDYFRARFSNNSDFQFIVNSGKGEIRIPEKKWKKLIETCTENKIEVEIIVRNNEGTYSKFEPFYLHVAEENIDPFLVYRLIHPGYYNWSQIKIVERSTETFNETNIVDNRGINKNCVNCHSFNQNNPGQFLIHVRGSEGGTYISDGNNTTRHDLSSDIMPGSATYPYWHPGGKYIAFSSNQVRQNFYAHADKSIEVYDLISSLILYDREKNEIINITGAEVENPLQTFPSWSPDGKFLYYCEAAFTDSTSSVPDVADVKDLKYNLKRIAFNASTRTFGSHEMVFEAAAIGKSVSFPRISPDGKYMIVTLADFGTFPIWHKEADLYLIDIETGKYKYLNLNSDETESYHSWSSNGKWLVFSSKRIDKRSATPFFAYFKDWDTIGKPFVLPQKDPATYDHQLESFNIPEFIYGKVTVNTRDIHEAGSRSPLEVKEKSNSQNKPLWLNRNTTEKVSDLERGVHE